MVRERNQDMPEKVNNAERLANLANDQVVKRVAREKDDDMILPETRERTEEEKNADVVPEDFESFNLDAATTLEHLKEHQEGPPEDE